MTDGKTIDELLVEWDRDWLESLELQIYDIQHHRQLNDEFMELLDGQDHPDTDIFRDAFHRMYLESQVMAIRRKADDRGTGRVSVTRWALVGDRQCRDGRQ